MSKIQIPPIPLAERARPKTVNEFQGQHQLFDPGKPIRLMIEKDSLSSFILWGPPGSGKTTIAKIIANQTNSDFHQINAVSSGVKEVRAIIEIANLNRIQNKKTILFIDEFHRFNKGQQDALLNAVESGLIILIGATTENPSFEIISALRSRTRIFVLEPLTKQDLQNILDFALQKDEFLSTLKINEIDVDFLIFLSGGDARVMLNILEAAITQEIEHQPININKAVLENVIQKKNTLYDKSGEEHYNVISAFIKSVRGSDPDAALYWLARMLEGGEDPLFIARRLVVLASEDIGNASPNALVLAEAAFSAIDKIGMPEARIILAQCTTYLAASPKSNSSYWGIENAISDVRGKALYPVPLHLRNAPTKLMKEVGYSKGYKYPHEFDNHFIDEDYFPKELKQSQYYFPTEIGQEKKLKDWLKFLWKNKKKY